MKYYVNYNPVDDINTILAYDEQKNGAARYAANGYFLYHGAIHVARIFNTPEQALYSCGEYSKKVAVMPNGSRVIPVDFFHPEQAIQDVFIPWSAIRGEVW